MKKNENMSSSMAGLMKGMQDRGRDDMIDDISELSDCPFSEGTDAAKNWYTGYNWVDRPEYVEEVKENNQFEIDETDRIARILAEYYIYTTEKYDRTICTGGFGPEGCAMYGCPEETKLSIENMKNVDKYCRGVLDLYGVSYQKFNEARANWRVNINELINKWDGGYLKEYECEFLEEGQMSRWAKVIEPLTRNQTNMKAGDVFHHIKS